MTTIGFHTGVGANNNHIDTYIQNNIQPFIKSTDDYGILQHALNLNHNSLCIFRQPVYDVPNYAISPKEAAIQHYNFIRSKLPPEFDKNRVWLEIMNEVDKNRTEWLAEFCLEFIILASDYKLVFFNWSTGEPEYAHWQGHKMSQLLRLCEQNKHRLAIGLHEYSLNINNIWQDTPYLVGRVKFLRELFSGTIFITEFGWAHNDCPDNIVDQIGTRFAPQNENIYQMYHRYNVNGLALWCLNSGWGNLPDKLNSQLLEINQWLTANYQPLTNTQPPVNNRIKHTIHLLPQDTTLAELEATTNYLHPNRTAFTYSADAAKDLVLAGTPESKVVCWDAQRWPSDLVAWFNARNVFNIQLRHFSEIMGEPQPLPPPNSYVYRGRPVNFTPALHQPGSDWQYNDANFRAFLHETELPIKFMTNGVSANYYNEFKQSQFDLTRIYYQFGNQYKSPQVLFDELKGDIERFYLQGARQFEIFNEPNLPQEGLGIFWQNGKEFGQYIKQFITLCKQKFPLIKAYFPGMSPGLPYTNQLVFTQAAINECSGVLDGFCLHAYTGITNDKYAASNDVVNQVLSIQSYLKLQIPLIVSECSVNRGSDFQYKAQTYRLIEFSLRDKAGIEGLVYFISYWQPPPEQAEHNENWYQTPLLEYYK